MSAPAAARLQRRARVTLGEYPVDAVFAPDARSLLVGDGAGLVQLLDVAGGALQPFGTHAGGVLALAWQPGGKLIASSGQDGEVRLADARTRESRVLLKSPAWSERLAFAPQGKLLAVASGRTLRVYANDGSERTEPLVQPGTINAMAWRPKGLELATLGNGGARLHRMGTSVETVEHARAGACLTASWSADGRILASGLQEGSVHFWNIGANTQSQMRGYGTKVALTSFSANGRLLATGADQAIVVWDFSGGGPEGSEPVQLSTHTARLTQLAFQPQGPLLASGARDHRLVLWRPGQGADPLDADLLGGEVALLRWSADGRWLAAGDSAGQLTIYEVAAGR
jgi:WD40 repeat protein